MTRWLRWLWMLSKRLYKRAAFLAIVALIPLSVMALEAAAQMESGFIHVVLSQTSPEDPVSTAIIEDFMAEETLVLFTYEQDPRTATDMVRAGEADAAWIFPDDLQGQVDAYVGSDYHRGGFVTVVEREQTILSRITHEKLNFALQEYTARACYLQFTRENVEALDSLTDAELMTYFNEVEIKEELFLFRTADGDASAQPQADYLMTPVRGLLGILMVLCGLAAALFYYQDRDRGTFALVSQQRQGAVALVCLLVAVLNISVAVLVALLAGGVALPLLQELALLLLYVPCCAAFCLLVLRLCRGTRTLAAVLPVLMVGMIAICPVFIDLRRLLWVQLLFPPTYFMNGAANPRWLLYMLGYTLVCLGLAYGVEKICRVWRRSR